MSTEQKTVNIEPDYNNLISMFTKDVQHYMARLRKPNNISRDELHALLYGLNIVAQSINKTEHLETLRTLLSDAVSASLEGIEKKRDS